MSTEEILANLVQKVENRFYGKYRGFVIDNNDPGKLGRLKVTVPAVLGDEVKVWAYPCVPYGGNANQGFFFIPEKESGVWIEFEEGDPEFPIWVGTFWTKPKGKSEAPKPNGPDGKEKGEVQSPPSAKIIKTKKGHTIQLEDIDGSEMVTIVDGQNKNFITLDQNGITISAKNNGTKITMTAEGITIKGTNIKIGDGAAEKLVKGTTLATNVATFITALSSHTHPAVCSTPGVTVTLSSPADPFTLDVPLSSNHSVE
jgi:hypothetical protein